MTKITLNNVVDLTQPTTSATTINSNTATIVTAFDNTLSRDGTAPNTMGASLDMDSHRILNLPAPVSLTEPLRLTDANTLNGGGTIHMVPSGGTTGQVLAKTSGTDYAINWVSDSTLVSAGTNMAATGTNPVTLSTVTSPSFATITSTSLTASSAVASDGSKNLVSVTNTGTGNNVLATSPTLVTPTLGAATATTVAFSPTTGGIIGTTTNDNATAGNVGEYVESNIASGSSVSLVTATAKDITSISLTAGDWDVWFLPKFNGGATTTISLVTGSISTTANTLDTTVGRNASTVWYAAAVLSTYGTPPNSELSSTPIRVRMSLSATTTVRAVMQASFGTSTLSGFGLLFARRIR